MTMEWTDNMPVHRGKKMDPEIVIMKRLQKNRARCWYELSDAEQDVLEKYMEHVQVKVGYKFQDDWENVTIPFEYRVFRINPDFYPLSEL